MWSLMGSSLCTIWWMTQVSANLRSTVTQYIKENQLKEDQFGFKNCSPTPNLDHNCCPLRAGRGTLRLVIHRAAGLRADTFTKTDAYVKIFYNGIYEETETVMDDNDPVWNVTYGFGSVELGQQLRFEVWDRDVLYNDVAGRCVVFPERGTHSLSCQLNKGVLYFTYTVKSMRRSSDGLQISFLHLSPPDDQEKASLIST
ncbi:Perforin-1 [Collichthys lucidus]|uniref:Perforin-1 n=1 Tax=Collichthys lucidus TaxID=240159 RepID=A0A4U5UTL6_COLLU|nr:Perforin-1 [Collichthys lucidus]